MNLRFKQFINAYEPDQILSPEEYNELTDAIYPRIKDFLDGQPLFYLEEFEDETIPNDGENIDEVQPKIMRRRKVSQFWYFPITGGEGGNDEGEKEEE